VVNSTAAREAYLSYILLCKAFKLFKRFIEGSLLWKLVKKWRKRVHRVSRFNDSLTAKGFLFTVAQSLTTLGFYRPWRAL
jgi:hypothetical protein